MNKPIPSIWDDKPDDPAEAIWFMCQHLDHLAKGIYEHPEPRVAALGWELIDAADYIQRHLDILSPAPTDDG